METFYVKTMNGKKLVTTKKWLLMWLNLDSNNWYTGTHLVWWVYNGFSTVFFSSNLQNMSLGCHCSPQGGFSPSFNMSMWFLWAKNETTSATLNSLWQDTFSFKDNFTTTHPKSKGQLFPLGHLKECSLIIIFMRIVVKYFLVFKAKVCWLTYFTFMHLAGPFIQSDCVELNASSF